MTFQILCLSGGGFLGLYSAAVAAAIEEETGRPLGDSFDLIAGTSVGGIIALGLAAGTPAARIRDAFIERGGDIFSDRPPPNWLGEGWQLLTGVAKARYPQKQLRATVDAIVPREMTLGDLGKPVLIPAVNLTKGQPQVFKTAHHPSFKRDWRLAVADVALATSAAPTFFPIHHIGGEMFADGGLYANSPDQIALHEAEHFLKRSVAEIRMLSIGTTTSSFSFSNAIGHNLGSWGWMKRQRLTSAMIASQQLNTDYMMQHRLGDHYVRIDRIQSKEQERQLRLDVASRAAIADLLALAEASVREHLPRAATQNILSHRAPPATFHHRGN